MKKAIVLVVNFCMICVSMAGAVSFTSIEKYTNNGEIKIVDFDEEYHISTEEATSKIANTAEKYFSLNEETYKIAQQTMDAEVEVPWTGLYQGDLLEWYVRIIYNGEEFLQEIPISIGDFKDRFLTNPNYGKELTFDVDSDPEDDLFVIIGFYWSLIMYPDGQLYKSLVSRFRIKQLSSGDYLDDQYGELEVWSEIHVNLGLLQPKSRSRPAILSFFQDKFENSIFGKLIQNILDKIKNSPLKILIDRLINRNNNENDNDIEPLDTDNDYISVGAGYRSPAGEQIPNTLEKRFSFAKGLKWSDGSIFKPAIFQHEMSPCNTVIGDAKIELLYGFRAHEVATGQDKFDVTFSVGFQPAVNLKTKFIPRDGYVAYFLNIPGSSSWGGWTPRSQPTTISFTADINKGSGQDVPKLSLTLDKIDQNLAGSSLYWFSFDITGLNGFKYEASHRFNVGITVDVPGYFTEKIEVKGLPTAVEAKWGIDDLDFIISQNKFYAKLGVFSSLTMSSNIDKVSVFYPKFEGSEDAPDSPFLEIRNVPKTQRVDLGGFLDLEKSSSNVLTVDVSGGVSMSSSGNIADATLYYPKADWENDPDIKLLDIPSGLPGSASANVNGYLRVNLDDLMDPNNRIKGSINHGFNDNVDQVDVFLPSEQEIPILRFTQIPSRSSIRGDLYWAQLKGEAYASRSSDNKDPIELNLEYGDYNIYNKLEIRDGHIWTKFHINQNGYFELDTTPNLFKNNLRINNYENGDQLLLSVDDVSATEFKSSWDIDTSGEQLVIEDLALSGVIDTLNQLEVYINFVGKHVSLEMDWEIGEEGNFDIEINQDDEITIDFDDLFDLSGTPFDMHGYITLYNNLGFDAQWRLKKGEDTNHPGYIKLNKEHVGEESNIKEFDLYFTYTNPSGNVYGIDLYMYNPTFYMDLQWYINFDLWPPVYTWFEIYIGAEIFEGDLIWTNPNNGETFYIDLEDLLP